MNEQEFAELAAGHALNALSPADRAAFEDALVAHPEWSSIVAMDADSVAALADTVADVAPPLGMRSALLSQIAATAQDAPADEPVEPAVALEPAPSTSTMQAVSRRNWSRGLLALAASLVLLVVVGFGAASLGQWINRSPEVIALQEIEAAPDAQSATTEVVGGGTATAHWSASLGKAVLVTDGLPTIADDETFELWFVRDDGTAVAAGTFDASRDAETTAALDGAMQPGDTIAVTVEQSGGSATGTPTTEPIVAIPTA
ncbi:MAG: anti-sigma factor [Microbacterium sp.]